MTFQTYLNDSISEERVFEELVGEELNNYYAPANVQVVPQYRFDGNRDSYNSDYSVFIPGQVDPILAIEVKCNPDDRVIKRLIDRARSIRPFREGITRLLLAVEDKGDDSIRYYDLSAYILHGAAFQALSETTKLERLPTINTLRSEARFNKAKSERKTINAFKIACWALAVLGVALLVLDYLEIYEPVWENLAVIAGVCANSAAIL